MKRTYGKFKKGITIKDIRREVLKSNVKLIDEFINYKRGSITDKRLNLIYNSLIKFADLIELEFEKATKDDITRAWNLIYSSNEVTVKTKQDEYVHIRQAFKHWFGEDEEFPKIVRGMKRPKMKGKLKLPQKMPSEQLIYKAIKLCQNNRDKLFIAFPGLDSGTRPIETRYLKWIDLYKDEHGYYFKVKTAKNSGDTEFRSIRIIYSEPYLLDWMQSYPGDTTGSNYVFCNLHNPNQQMSSNSVTSLFKRLKKKLGTNTKFTAYTLRHATLTRLSKNPNAPVALIKKLAGHSTNSNVLGEYLHFDDDDVKLMQLSVSGKVKDRDQKSFELKKKPVICPHCKKSNPFDREICGFCNFALSQNRLVEVEELRLSINKFKQELELIESNNLMNLVTSMIKKQKKMDETLKNLEDQKFDVTLN